MSKQKLIALAIINTFSSVALFAGSIKIGTGANGQDGLTAAYMASAGACVGAQLAQAGFTTCVAPNITGAAMRDYNGFLWSTAVPSGVGPNGNVPGGLQLADTQVAGVTYSMINNGTGTCAANAGACNFWSLQASQSLTIPIGIFQVDTVHIMLNDYWGNGTGSVTVTLDFGSASSGGAVTSVPFLLTDGNQIRSAVECTGPAVGQSASCPAFSYNTSSPATSKNVFTTSYTDWTNTGSPFFHTQGTLALDALALSVPGADKGLWLQDIKVSFTGGAVNQSRGALSAITIETVPEPSTWMLGFGCLGLVGYFARRSQRSSTV